MMNGKRNNTGVGDPMVSEGYEIQWFQIYPFCVFEATNILKNFSRLESRIGIFGKKI